MRKYSTNNNLLEYPAPEDVFYEYCTQCWQEIYSYLLEHANDSNMALSLTQNVFLKFWTLNDKYPEIGNAKAYLKQMAKNVFHDTCRQEKNKNTYLKSLGYEIELSKNLTEAMLDERELERTFQQALLHLSKQRKIVFVLSQIEGWPREKSPGL
jgi:RNA polymerase sigma factor (sigma-70 family)